MKQKPIIRRAACLLALLLCLQLSAPAAAASSDRLAAGQAAAEELYALGLFRGVGDLPDGSPDFALDRTLTRGEAVTMLVRLVGGEREAILADYCHNFRDAGWADAYIGYAFYYGIANGVSTTAFDTNTAIDAAQFVTLILRALGHDGVDWQDPWPVAASAGLSCPRGGDFLRADAAVVCRNALGCQVAGEGVSLRRLLEQQGVIGGTSVPLPAGPFVPGPAAPMEDTFQVNNRNEMANALFAALEGHAQRFTFQVPPGQESDMIYSVINATDGVIYSVNQTAGGQSSYIPDSGTLWVEQKYCDSAELMAMLEGRRPGTAMTQEQLALANMIKHFLAANADPSASDYELVKLIHDYIVEHTVYRSDASGRTGTAAGCLLDGAAVCGGYAKAFDLMCYMAGIECIQVCGDAFYSGGQPAGYHAWNKVKVDGQWYNVDCTWDDAVTTSGQEIPRWDYFLISDATLSKDHTWTHFDFQPDAPSDYPR